MVKKKKLTRAAAKNGKASSLNGHANGAAKRLNGVKKLNGSRMHLAPGDSPGAIDVESQPTSKTPKPSKNGIAVHVPKRPKTRKKPLKNKRPTASKKPRVARKKQAKQAPESRIPTPESLSDSPAPDPRPLTPVADRRLIDRALAQEPGAWDDLYYRCHQPLLSAIRAIIGSRSPDQNLIDELAARVWYAVVRDDAKLLNRFDPSRQCSLTTYLALLAKDEASRLFRSEKRRRKRETAVATSDTKIPSKNTPAPGSTTITLDEFAATLTPAEKTFYQEITTALGENITVRSHSQNGHNGAEDTEKTNDPPLANAANANANGTNANGAKANGRSQANEWQLNHRVRRKLERFLTG